MITKADGEVTSPSDDLGLFLGISIINQVHFWLSSPPLFSRSAVKTDALPRIDSITYHNVSENSVHTVTPAIKQAITVSGQATK